MKGVHSTQKRGKVVASAAQEADRVSAENIESSSNDPNVSRNSSIGATAKLLSSRQEVGHDGEDFSFRDDDSDESSSPENDEALAELHFAATRRKDLNRDHLKEARKVEPIYGKESVHSIPVEEEISQKDMMWRMMRALSKTEEGEGGTGRTALEKKIRRLHANGKQALSVPLPAPVQGRLERASAYDNTKDNISQKWGRIVQKNRKAKQLVFPLNGPGKETGGSTTAIVGNFKPETNYEEEIDSLLREAGVSTDQDVLNQEDTVAGDLETAPVTKEEVLQRRRELAKIRSLMFHYEHKMKRIKKIKSKKYRRVMKREKERLAETMGDSDDEETRAKRAEQRRVEERMTLRHKNTSKWVRRQLQRKEGNRNPATKAAIEEQLRMHEELRRRQESEVNNSETSDDEGPAGDVSNEDDVVDDEETLRQELTSENRKTNRKGLMGMRFMKAAQDRKRKEALALLQSMDEENEEEQPERSLGPVGRQSFQGSQLKDKLDANANIAVDDPGASDRRVDEVSADDNVSAPSPHVSPSDGPAVHCPDMNTKKKKMVGFGFTTKLNGRLSANDNPWLTEVGHDDEDQKITRKTRDTTQSRESKKGCTLQDEPLIATTSKKSSFPSVIRSADGSSYDEDNKNLGVSPRKLQKPAQKTTVMKNSKQDELLKLTQPDNELLRMQDISHAFAGVGGAEQAEFEAAKQSEVERNMPTARSLQAEVLPGWGSWNGAGMPKAKRRRAETPFAKAARERLEAARANTANKRSDREMRHVILNEKRVKQATDLTLSSVPFPFTSREQWEREVDTSVCRELVTTAAFREAVGKRVVAKPGTIIEPIRQSESANKRPHRGKRGIIDLRKERSEKRSRARRGLMA